MLGLTRRKKTKPYLDASFRERVDAFWDWFERNAVRFYDTIESGECDRLLDEVSSFMDTTLPHLSWVFGPGEGGGHSFTLSGEGIVAKQLLTARWLQSASELAGWTFYAARQPAGAGGLANMSVGIGSGESVGAEGFLICSTPDIENQKFDIVAWHPQLTKVPEIDQMTILFLLLDEALGEFGTEQWLGQIDLEPFNESSPPRVNSKIMSLTELPTFVEQAFRYHQWQKLPPLEAYTGYETRDFVDGPRGDTIAGTTMIPDVVSEYLSCEGKLEKDDLAGTGAELAYVRFRSENLPAGQETDTRANIENALDEAFENEGVGRTLGGAVGVHQSYIDLVLFDRQRSDEVVNLVLATLHLRGEFAIERF